MVRAGELLADRAARDEMGARARMVVDRHTGAATGFVRIVEAVATGAGSQPGRTRA